MFIRLRTGYKFWLITITLAYFGSFINFIRLWWYYVILSNYKTALDEDSFQTRSEFTAALKMLGNGCLLPYHALCNVYIQCVYFKSKKIESHMNMGRCGNVGIPYVNFCVINKKESIFCIEFLWKMNNGYILVIQNSYRLGCDQVN